MSTNLESAQPAMADPQPLRKFLFERSFSDDTTLVVQPEKPKPIYTAEQLEAAKRDGYEEGLIAGKQAAHKEFDTRTQTMLERVRVKMEELMATGAAAFEEQNNDMQSIALMIARKALPTYLERHGLDEIRGMIEQVIREVGREPRLVIRIAEKQFDEVNAMVQEITKQQAYAGKVVLLAEEGLGPSDCRLEWADGGIARDMKDLWQRLDAIIERPPISSSSPSQPDSPSGEAP